MFFFKGFLYVLVILLFLKYIDKALKVVFSGFLQNYKTINIVNELNSSSKKCLQLEKNIFFYKFLQFY